MGQIPGFACSDRHTTEDKHGSLAPKMLLSIRTRWVHTCTCREAGSSNPTYASRTLHTAPLPLIPFILTLKMHSSRLHPRRTSQRSFYPVLPALMAPHPVSSVDCFSTKLRFDEWDHACSQPGGVQWGARIRQHRGELSAETETILIATGATSANDGHENGVGHATSVHAKLDEQCAELHMVCCRQA